MSYLANLSRALVGAQTKASSVGHLIARVVVGRSVWNERDAKKLAMEGYRQNAVAHRCIKLIAACAADIPWQAFAGETELPDTHKLLALLDRPRRMGNGHTLKEAVCSHLMISGNAYIERSTEEPGTMELFTLRPDRTTVVPGADGEIMAYEYRNGGEVFRFDVDIDRDLMPVLHIKTFHPLDDWYGMSPLDPVGWSVDAHNKAAAYQTALLDNAATPSGAFVFEGDKEGGNTLSTEQYERLKQQMETEYTGARNAGKPLILEGGMTWAQIGLDLQKMQHIDAKNQAAREVAFGLGVPPMLLGIPGDNTYSNYQEAGRAFYRETVIPLANMVAQSFAAWLAGPFAVKDLRFELDLDQIPALMGERESKWQRIQEAEFLTLNEKREALGFPPITGGDELMIDSNKLPLTDGLFDSQPNAGDEDAGGANRPAKTPARKLFDTAA